MADGVRFILDKLAALFRRLEDTELFSKDEVKSIVKKVTDNEYVLKRRQLEVADYQSYLKYTLALDKLLGARVKALEEKTEKMSKDVHDMLFAIQKTMDNHIMYIFDRSVRRFPEEVVLWNDYIAFLQRKEATTPLNAVFGKALSLYPKNEDFWLQASIHELEANSNVHSARITLQRGLRANPSSSKLWLRYFELELWNALRATERQKALEIQEDYEALQGAPMVVFNHALMAVTDIHAVLEIYAACEDVGGEFALKLSNVLIAKYGHKEEVWQHLAMSALAPLFAKTDAEEASNSAALAPEGKGKRKLSDATADAEAVKKTEALIERVALALQQVVNVLEEGRTHISTHPENISYSDAYATMTARTLYQATVAATQCLGEISASAWVAWAAQAPQTTDVAAASVTPAAKKKKGAKKGGAAEESADSSNATSSTATALHGALQGLFALLGMIAPAASHNALTELTCVSQVVRHQVYLLSLLLQPGGEAASAFAGVEAELLTSEHLRAWVSSSASLLTKRVQSSTTPAKSGDAAEKLVDAFCLCVHAALDAKCEYIASQGLLRALLPCTSALVATSTGDAAAQRIYSTAQALGMENAVVATLQTMITDTSTRLTVSARGAWCIYYMTLLQAAETASASDKLNALQAAFGWVEGAVKAKPHLFHGSAMRVFYVHVLSAAGECVSSSSVALVSAEDKAVLNFEQRVAEKALLACPGEVAFWSALEQAQQRSGDLKGATHTRWRRDKALSSA